MADEIEVEAIPTHVVMAHLDDAGRDRFVKLQELFETAGWPLIVEQAKAMVFFHATRSAGAKTWEECVYNQGARAVWERIEKLAAEYMNAFEAPARDALAAKAEDLE